MSRRWKRAIAVVSVLLLVVFLGAIWIASSYVLVPPWRHYDGPFTAAGFVVPNDWAKRWWGGKYDASDVAFRHEDVELAAIDGKTLRGWLFSPSGTALPADTTAVLLVHGGGADRRSMLKYVEFLCGAGYAALAFDCRDHGKSDGDRRGCTFGERESQDVDSAAQWLKARGYAHVAAFGDSVGGASVIEAGARDPAIDAVLAQNAFADFEDFISDQAEARHLPRWFGALTARAVELRWPAPAADVRPVDDIAKIAPRPVMVLHGSADEMIFEPHGERLFAAAREPKEWLLVPGAHHATLWNTDRATFEARVLGFLARAFAKR